MSTFRNRLVDMALEGLKTEEISFDDLESCLRIIHSHNISSGWGRIERGRINPREARIHLDEEIQGKKTLSADYKGKSNNYWKVQLSDERKEELYEQGRVFVFTEKTRESDADIIWIE